MVPRKRLIQIIIVSLIFFAIGNFFAYFIFFRAGIVESSRSGFKNPTGAPYVKGPTGPPPQADSLQ